MKKVIMAGEKGAFFGVTITIEYFIEETLLDAKKTGSRRFEWFEKH